jgi:Lhr-like helicase
MGTHVSISGPEAADRLAIRELVDAYAHYADRRDAKAQMSLFTSDTHFVVFMDARSEKPSMEFNRREDLARVFDELNKYETTTHFMGQSTVVLDGDDDVHNFILQHDMGRNFSFLVKELYRYILEDMFKIKSGFTITDNTLIFSFRES